MLGLRLVALHNVAFLIGLMADARREIAGGGFSTWSEEGLRRYQAPRTPHT